MVVPAINQGVRLGLFSCLSFLPHPVPISQTKANLSPSLHSHDDVLLLSLKTSGASAKDRLKTVTSLIKAQRWGPLPVLYVFLLYAIGLKDVVFPPMMGCSQFRHIVEWNWNDSNFQ